MSFLYIEIGLFKIYNYVQLDPD